MPPAELPKDAKRVLLGDTLGNIDRDFYLYENGEVYVWESPNNAFSPSSWRYLPEATWDSYTVDGKTIRQLVEENRGNWTQDV